MKPLTLTMQAFGSYGRQATISFQEPGQNLFLITGDTGAGKTTIFDAIVFALYGEASSGLDKKDGVELQSHFAELSVEPFVELSFSQGGEVYTVRRVPRHLRPMKRKEGVREESETVSLFMPNGTVYPQKETDRKLEEIVGLAKGQFMQVAMIAQGEFMELLRARSDDKKVIFRKLFKTELYQDITEELGRRRKEKEKELARSRAVCQTEISHIRIPSYGRTGILEELKGRLTGEGKFSAADMELLLEELALLCGWLKERRDQAQACCQAAGRLRDEKRDAYASGTHLQKFFAQLTQAGEELAQCRAAEAGIRDKQVLIRQIRAAYEIEAEFRRYEDAARLAGDTKGRLERQQEELPGLQELAENAARREEGAKALLDKALENYNRVSERVSRALSLFAQIEKAQKELLAREKAARQAQGEALEAQKRLEGQEGRELSCREQALALAGAENLLALWEIKKQEAENLAEEMAGVGLLLEELERRRQGAQKAKEAYTAASSAYEKENRRYGQARRVFLDAQAGILARELRQGEPCPVCGSREHPLPCQLQAGEGVLSREALEALGRETEVLQKRQVQLAAASEAAAGLADEKEKAVKEAFGKLCAHLGKGGGQAGGEIPYPQAREMVSRKYQSVAREGVQLKKNAELLWETQEQLAQIAQSLGELRKAAGEAKEKAATAWAAWEGSRAALGSLEGARDYENAQAARDAGQAALEGKEREAAAYGQARGAARAAEAAKEQAKTLLQEYAQELPVKEGQARQRKASYEKMMAEKALEENRWRELAEKYQKEDADRLQAEVDSHSRKKASAEKMYAAAREAIGEQECPDMEKVKGQMEEAEKGLREAEGILERYQQEYRANWEVYAVLAPEMDKRGKILEEHTRLDALYRLVSGNVPGSRMDLETYVQRCYLEGILYGANRRFREMSAGQFELRMYGLDKAGEGRNRGLDLMVYSSVTGKEREIRTLSGGESFMAALSLALGMADQIQETSSAVHLDMMFIDEGFGSLDGHARNQAVRVLKRMAEGSRLIGIISHVAELKQEIEDQLVVGRDEKGSHVRWQAG